MAVVISVVDFRQRLILRQRGNRGSNHGLNLRCRLEVRNGGINQRLRLCAGYAPAREHDVGYLRRNPRLGCNQRTGKYERYRIPAVVQAN